MESKGVFTCRLEYVAEDSQQLQRAERQKMSQTGRPGDKEMLQDE